ncbi:MAG: FecR family protein [Tannerella sp.]|nr:FecR family protein [Tannerella sp.]
MDEMLLLRFLLKKCTPAEIRQVEQWATSDKANADWLFGMEQIWRLKDEQHFSEPQRIEKAYGEFLADIEHKKRRKTDAKKFYYSIKPFVKYVAIFIIIALLSSNLYQYVVNHKTSDILMNIVEVPKGQRASLTLSDGTKVWLNAQSQFIYPTDFSSKHREVSLIGEGFFEVTHNDKKPFIVNTDLVKVKVLGTKFNVKAHPDETLLVTLSEGKVEVSDNEIQNTVTLKPDQQVAYSKEKGFLISEYVDAGSKTLWLERELCFVEQPLWEITKELERQFNVVIMIKDQTLSNEIFTCRFKSDATLDQIMNNIKDTKMIDYKVNNKQIEIFKKENSL